MNFETRPVANLPPSLKTSGVNSGFTAAFGQLPEGLALFVPANGKKARTIQAGLNGGLHHTYPHRRVRTRVDREKDGVWFWWEPKP